MNEHDRLLAEGPPTAPEPALASEAAAGTVPAAPLPTSPARPGRGRSGSPQAGRRSRPFSLRLLPLAAVAVIAVARGVGTGSTAGVAFTLVWVAAVVLLVLRRVRR